jgi:pimeloyl-ACP methyl ester carboxylesterase
LTDSVRGLVLALASSIACAEPAPVELPPPTGAFTIGRTTARWIDERRPEPLTDAPSDAREITVHLWYPAEADPSEDPSAYVPDLDSLSDVLDERSEDVFHLTRIHAIADARVAADPTRFPVVVFSHGNDMLSTQYAFLIEELVSHGWAVAALDHPYDARAVLLSEGRSVGYLESAWPDLPPPDASGQPDEDSPHAAFYRARVQARVEDVGFVLDRLELGTDDPSTPWARLDLERVGFVGHSVGGVAAGALCLADARVDACVNLDGESPSGPYYLPDDGSAIEQPYMMLTKPFVVPDAQLARWGLTRESFQAMLDARKELFFASVEGGSYRVTIDGATHQSFSDEPFVHAALEDAPTDGHRARMQAIRRYVTGFFAKHIDGGSVPWLDANAPADGGVTLETWPPAP